MTIEYARLLANNQQNSSIPSTISGSGPYTQAIRDNNALLGQLQWAIQQDPRTKDAELSYRYKRDLMPILLGMFKRARDLQNQQQYGPTQQITAAPRAQVPEPFQG